MKKKLSKEIQQRILSCTREQMLQIHADLNEWRWNNLLGEKPEGYDNLPTWNTKLIHKIFKRKNKDDIVAPIIRLINKNFTEREILHYYWVNRWKQSEEYFEKAYGKYELIRD